MRSRLSWFRRVRTDRLPLLRCWAAPETPTRLLCNGISLLWISASEASELLTALAYVYLCEYGNS